jgi:hypothetical protein
MDKSVHQGDVSVYVIQFQTIKAYCNLDLTNVKYTTYKKNSGKKIWRLWGEKA